MNLTPLFFKLLRNGIRYRFHRFTGYPARPQSLSIEITRRCVAKCIMCNIWRTPPDTPELSKEKWLELLSSSLFQELRELDITGGEPFLREDLQEFLKGICDLKITNLRSLRSVAITTNGFLTERIESVMRRALLLMKDAGLELVIVFAMDGVGALHDEIRLVKNGWQKLDASIQKMRENRETYDNLIIGLKTTVLPMNVNELDGIAAYADQNGLFTIISPCIITENRYNNAGLKKDLQFGPEDLRRMKAFYESPHFMWSYHREMLLRFFQEGAIAKPCSAGFNYFFVRSTGDVYPCPLIKEGLGNFAKTPIEKLIGSPEARHFRRKIGTYRECRSCTEPGLERYALPLEGFHYLSLLLKMGKKRFLSLHQHMGLDKYL
jgi:MoaA/NifB/PqqE/SkfB family radical SAM enzyme